MQGGNGLRGVGVWRMKAKQQGVLAVQHNRNNAHRLDHIRRHIDSGLFTRIFRPVTGAWIDRETEDGLLAAPLESLVDATALGAVGVLENQDWGIALACRVARVSVRIASWPDEPDRVSSGCSLTHCPVI